VGAADRLRLQAPLGDSLLCSVGHTGQPFWFLVFPSVQWSNERRQDEVWEVVQFWYKIYVVTMNTSVTITS
jgi:hypothetical protein